MFKQRDPTSLKTFGLIINNSLSFIILSGISSSKKSLTLCSYSVSDPELKLFSDSESLMSSTTTVSFSFLVLSEKVKLPLDDSSSQAVLKLLRKLECFLELILARLVYSRDKLEPTEIIELLNGTVLSITLST